LGHWSLIQAQDGEKDFVKWLGGRSPHAEYIGESGNKYLLLD